MGSKRQLRGEPHADFAEAGKICRVPGVIDRMFAVAQNISAIAAMSIAQYACSPMPRRHMRDGHVAMAIAVPPVQLDHIAKTEIRDQIKNVLRHNDGRRRAPKLPGVLDQRSQRWPVQVIEVRMGDEHQINRRQIADPHSRLAQSFQDKKPAREVGIDDDVLAAHLQEKTGMANEGHAHLAIRYQHRLVRLADSRRHG